MISRSGSSLQQQSCKSLQQRLVAASLLSLDSSAVGLSLQLYQSLSVGVCFQASPGPKIQELKCKERREIVWQLASNSKSLIHVKQVEINKNPISWQANLLTVWELIPDVTAGV